MAKARPFRWFLTVRMHGFEYKMRVWEGYEPTAYDTGDGWFHTPEGSFRVEEILERKVAPEPVLESRDFGIITGKAVYDIQGDNEDAA